MQTKVSGLVFVLLTALSPAALAAPPAKPAVAPQAQKALADSLTGAAKADYDAAKVLVGDGDFAGARVKFQSAYETSKDPRLLWNIAASEKQLRHYAKALELLRKYEADTGTLVTAKDRDEAKELIRTLEPFTVAVTVDVDEGGAVVEVDDVVLGNTPLASIVLDIGEHRLRIRKDGFRDHVGSITVGGSATKTVSVKLQREVHEGKLSLQVPAGASIVIDGQPLPATTGKEPVEAKLPSGGHTVRVTAPRMRAYEREVVVRDNETRVIEIQLEPEAEAERPKLRVGVGCVDATPRSIDEGLALYIDGSPAAATASGGRKTLDATLGRDVVDYVEFPVSTGTHRVQVRIPGCEPREASVDVGAAGGELRGALRSESPTLVRGPAGNPDWGRIAVSLWLPRTIPGANVGIRKALAFSSEAESALTGLSYATSATGISVQPGLAFRWLTMMLDLGYAGGSASVDQAPAVTTPGVLAAVDTASVSWLRAGVRAGARFPFNLAAFHLGAGTGYDNITLSGLAAGIRSRAAPGRAYYSGWAMLEIYVICDVPLFAGVHFDRNTLEEGTYGLQFGAAFQPNKTCRAERGTTYELTSRAGGGP